MFDKLQDNPKERRNQSKRSKNKRVNKNERLLKFHQKLVDVSGLPPSRIMLEKQTPKLSPAKGGLSRRKLEFENSEIPKVPEPRVEINNHYSGAGNGDTSKIENSQMLFSTPQPLINGGENTWMTGSSWSEARPGL